MDRGAGDAQLSGQFILWRKPIAGKVHPVLNQAQVALLRLNGQRQSRSPLGPYHISSHLTSDGWSIPSSCRFVKGELDICAETAGRQTE
jgi:hypothetical protein